MKFGGHANYHPDHTQYPTRRARKTGTGGLTTVQIDIEEQNNYPTRRHRYRSNPKENVMKQSAVKKKPRLFTNPFGWMIAHKFMSTVLLASAFGAGFYAYHVSELRKSGLEIGFFDPIKTAASIVASESSAIEKLEKSNGRTNLLVIGVDARGNNESLLTDSLMLMSYEHATQQTAQISFPRDLEASYQLNGRTLINKINSIFPNTYSHSNSYETSFEQLSNAIEAITTLPVHYGVMVNFNGFIKVIDTLGGVTINVPNGFSDYQFPNSTDTGYAPVHFQSGVQKMDGETALKYARSRKGTNGEGSDYARARRQQLVINAIKEEFMSSNMIQKADIVNQMTSILGENVHFFNLGTEEFNLALESRDILTQVQTFSMVIDPEFGSYTAHLLFGTDKGNGAGFVVTPKAGDYTDVQELISLYLEHPYLITQDPRLRVLYSDYNNPQDYTQVKNLLYTNALQFDRNNNTDYAMTVGSVAGVSDSVTSSGETTNNETTSSSTQGVLYDVSDGTKTESLNFYKEFFKENGIVFEIKSTEQFPAELEQFLDDSDFIVLIS